MSSILLFLAVCSFVFELQVDDCKKVTGPVPVEPWMTVVLAEIQSVRVLQGRIVDPGDDPAPGAFVEIIKLSTDGQGELVYVCKTGQTGRFRFKGLPEGSYEVRVSLPDHDRTIIRVNLTKSAPRNKEVLVTLKASN